jgi:hypothetical protein
VKDDALANMDEAYEAIVAAFAPMPDSALAWLKPGDDYAIGGIVIHLISSLDGYIGTRSAAMRRRRLTAIRGARRGRRDRGRATRARAARSHAR